MSLSVVEILDFARLEHTKNTPEQIRSVQEIFLADKNLDGLLSQQRVSDGQGGKRFDDQSQTSALLLMGQTKRGLGEVLRILAALPAEHPFAVAVKEFEGLFVTLTVTGPAAAQQSSSWAGASVPSVTQFPALMHFTRA